MLLPLHSVSGVISLTGPVETEEAGKSVRTEFTLQHFEGITIELLIGHLLDRRHTSCSRNHSTGFRTRTRGEPAPRRALLMNRSSVVSNTSAVPASALLKCNASKAPYPAASSSLAR